MLVFVLVNLGQRIKGLEIIELFIHFHKAFLKFEVNLISEMSVVSDLNKQIHHDNDVKERVETECYAQVLK